MEKQIVEKIFDELTPLSQLQWDKEYRTSETLKLVIGNGSKIKSSLQCRKVCWFLNRFTRNAAGRSIACTTDVIDFIFQLMEKSFATSLIISRLQCVVSAIICNNAVQSVREINHATKPRSINILSSTLAKGYATGNIIVSNDTPETVFEIIDALNKNVTTPESVQNLCFVIAFIANNPEGQRLFSTPEAVSAIINALNKYATTPDCIQYLGFAVGKITFDNPEGKRFFSTPVTVGAIINAFNNYATTPESVQNLGYAIGNITFGNPEGQRLFSTPEAVSAIINALSKYATTPESVGYLGLAIGRIANCDEGQRLFSTPEAVSAIISALSKFATTPESVGQLGLAIGNITFDNPQGQRLFSTPEAVSAIISALNKYFATSESVRFLAFVIVNISCNNSEGQLLFSTLETESAIINALKKYATTPESLQYLGSAVGKITFDNPEGTLNAAPEAVAAIVDALNNYAITEESVDFVIGNIIVKNYERKRLFSTLDAASEIISALNKYATTPESVQSLCTSIINLTYNNPQAQQLFSTPESAAVIARLLDEYSANLDSISNLISAAGNIVFENLFGKQLFAQDNLMSLIVSMLERSSNPNCLGALLVLFAYLRDDTTTIDSAVIRSAVARFLSSDFEIDGNAAEHLMGIFSLGNEFSEAACSRDILRGLEQFVASEMTSDYPQKQHVLDVIPKISSRLVSRFQKWLLTLMEKHNFDNTEEKIPEELVKLLFELELDETTFLQKNISFFNSLEQVPSEIKTLLKKLIEAETTSTQQASEFIIPASQQYDFNKFTKLQHRLTEEFRKEKVFAPTDISYGPGNRGTGTYGSVRIASIISQQHKHVAAKVFKDSDHGIAEAKNYRRLAHLNITNFIGVTIDPQTLGVGLLLELADCDFSRVINSLAPPLSINKIKRFTLQIASGLEYLHKEKIRHLDLKPQNILVFQQGKEVTVKLADFGSMLETKKTFTEKAFVAGTKLYLPPEHHAASEHCENILVSATFDIFAFGVILMEMLVWNDEKRKKKIKEIENVKEKVKNGEIILLDSEESCINDDDWREDALSDENGRTLIAICKKCLMINPAKRYSDGVALVRALKDLAEDEEDVVNKQEQQALLRALQERIMLKARVREDISRQRKNTLNAHHETLASKSMPTSQRFCGESVSLSFHAIDEFPSNTKQNNDDDDE